MKPAIAPGVRSGLRIVVVAVVHGPRRLGAKDQLPDFAVTDAAIVFIDKPDFDAGARTAANAVLGRVGAGNQRRADFRHVEQREYVDAEALPKRSPGLAERNDEHHAQLVIAISRVRRLLEQKRRHRAKQKSGRYFQLAHLVPERFGAKMTHHGDRASDTQRYGRNERSADVKDRHVQQLPVICRQTVPGIGADAGIAVHIG